MKDEAINVTNANGIDVKLYRALTRIEDENGTHPGDDMLMLAVESYKAFDTDFCQNGNAILNFTKSQAKRFARQLLRVAQDLMTAEERADTGDTPVLTISPGLLKKLGV